MYRKEITKPYKMMVSILNARRFHMRDDPSKDTPPAIYARARELRQDLTHAETIMWNALRDRRLNGLKFRRQHPVGLFIADFYCAKYRLIVEVDGGIHEHTIEEDLSRTRQLADYGYRVIRFSNNEIEMNLPQVLSTIQIAWSTPSSEKDGR
jgi:very-short-patch-repair endonuclease